jgi:adenylylsulfate kinase-like enzyme
MAEAEQSQADQSQRVHKWWQPGGMLIVMAGLPGSGKSVVAEDLGRVLSCAVLGVDQVEAAMWCAG